MKNLIKYTLAFLLVFNLGHVKAQLKTGNKLYQQLKFNEAIPFYLKVINEKKEGEKKEAIVKLADCYRLISDFTEASVWYEKAMDFNTSDPNVFYNYANVLRTQAKYDLAEKYYLKFLEHSPDDERARSYSEYCRDISGWQNLEPSAQIENEEVLNSKFSDFSPVHYKNGLVIISDRNVDQLDNHNYSWTGNGYLDLYFAAYSENGKLQVPEKMSKTFNQTFHDGPVCFSEDESEVFITRTSKHKKYKKDTVQTHFSYITIIKLNDKKIKEKAFAYNSIEHSVGHPTLSNNGKTLIFSSNKKGGFGDSDLYYCELKDGKWTTPVNLGSEINTFGKENFPYLSDDNTLYFSSDGHMGYGGLDIYVSEFKHGKWQKPKNLMAPINSSYDDFGILFNKKNNDGYFSSDRPGGKGADDIYKFSNYKSVSEPNY